MNTKESFRLGQLTDHLMAMQSLTGVCFDQEKALELYNYCIDRMTVIEETIEPQLPSRPLNKGELQKVTPPKIQFKNSKQGLIPSATCEKFFDKTSCNESKEEWYGWLGDKFFKLPYNKPIVTEGAMKLANQKDLKDYLIGEGWKPTIYNLKKDKAGKPLRVNGHYVKTTPKFHENGDICPNLLKLGNEDFIKPIIEWLSLRNRKSVIYNPEKNTGWLSNSRLKMDGRLPAGASSITNTMRQKHSVVVNVPRPGSVLGEEMRSLFVAENDNVIVGYDASGLEGRVEAHYCYSYEGGEEYANEIVDGDVHSKNANIFFGEDLPLDDDCKVTPEYRNLAKNGKYCLSYGGQASKLAETLGISKAKGKALYDGFWDGNTALKGLRDRLTKHWEGNHKKFIICPLTGCLLHSRSGHSLVNLLFQHTGAIVMDVANSFMHKWLGGIELDAIGRPFYMYKGYKIKRILYVHDEVQWECSTAIAKEIGELGCRSIEAAGKFLKMNVPMLAEYKIGCNWKETH